MRRSGWVIALVAVAILAGSASHASAQHGGRRMGGTWWMGSYTGYPVVITGPFPPVFVPADPFFATPANTFAAGMVDPNAGVLANLPRGAARGNAGGNNVGGNNAAVANAGGPGMMAVGGNAPVAGPVPADQQIHGKPRTTNAAAKVRAGKFIQYGDAQFVKQKYNSAVARYREAATAAADLADPYFRQAFALLALGQYDTATRALERGLRIRPNWPATKFELSTIYGPNGELAQATNRETLAQAIEENPHSPDQLVLMGLLLYCAGQQERSQLFFNRAIDLGANAEHLLDGFVAPRPAEPAPAPVAEGAAKL